MYQQTRVEMHNTAAFIHAPITITNNYMVQQLYKAKYYESGSVVHAASAFGAEPLIFGVFDRMIITKLIFASIASAFPAHFPISFCILVSVKNKAFKAKT